MFGKKGTRFSIGERVFLSFFLLYGENTDLLIVIDKNTYLMIQYTVVFINIQTEYLVGGTNGR